MFTRTDGPRQAVEPEEVHPPKGAPRPRANRPALHRRLRRWFAGVLLAEAGGGSWTRYLKPMGLVISITGVGALLDLRVAPTNLAMLYLLGVVFVSCRWGFGPALTYSAVSTMTFDFFFIPPYEAFAITDIWYFITATTFMCVGLIICVLTASVRHHATEADRREAYAATLYGFMQSLASARGLSEVIDAAATQIRTTLGLDTALLLAGESGLVAYPAPGCPEMDAATLAAAEERLAAARNGAVDRNGVFLPLRAGEEVIGVMVLMRGPSLFSGNTKDSLLESMAGQMALAIQRAMLEEKAREAERAQLRAQRAKAEAIATLAGGLAHDLNHLLTGVLGNASLAAESLPADHPSKRWIDALTKAGERAAQIVAQVLSYSGKGRRFDELVDLSASARWFVKCLPSPPANIEVHLQLQDDLPVFHGDSNQVLQLIGNLYLNAVEAIGEAPGQISISTYREPVWIGASGGAGGPGSPRECVCLSVTDTGCGIEPSIRPRIFDPFFTTKFIGRGLGLSAAEGIMRAHGGAIRVASEPGKGSTFVCQFPVHPGGSSQGAQL